jgi:hypothetical protein
MLDAKSLYALLPAIYRIRDAELASHIPGSGGIGPLRALFDILAGPIDALDEGLDQFYDDQFIETCDGTVVPYIGDLIDFRPLLDIGTGSGSARAEVAHTIAYRRRKGTLSVLERLARDVTRWDARAVEFFQLIATTQYVNHVRRDHLAWPSLHRWEPLEQVGRAFDALPRTVDVRRIASGRGRYNIPNIGLFLWPHRAQTIQGSTAVRIDDQRFVFSPNGIDAAIVGAGDPDAPLGERPTTPLDVAVPLTRRRLAAHLSTFYGAGRTLHLNVDGTDIDRATIMVANLGDTGGGWAHMPPAGVYAIDPLLGRIALPSPLAADKSVRVTLTEAVAADLGGGDYERTDTFDVTTPGSPIVRVPVVAKLQDAIDQLPNGGIVEITDSARYVESLTIVLNPSAHLEIRAVSGARPTIELTAELDIVGGTDARVTLNGLLILGQPITVKNTAANKLREITVKHCTLVPGLRLQRDGTPAAPTRVSLQIERPGTKVAVERSICGALTVDAGCTVVWHDSIIDATASALPVFQAPDGSFGGVLSVRECTVIGTVKTRVLELASNSIFTSLVTAENRQNGCLRFCYVPLPSRVPRRYRCQPTDESVVLQFATLRYGQRSYGELSTRTDLRIRRGADDESEMGAFQHGHAPQREANLRMRLDEYLRAGLEAGLFYER